jgi:hypothetical protein
LRIVDEREARLRCRRFFDLCRAELERLSLPYVTLSGSSKARLEAAVAAVEDNLMHWHVRARSDQKRSSMPPGAATTGSAEPGCTSGEAEDG